MRLGELVIIKPCHILFIFKCVICSGFITCISRTGKEEFSSIWEWICCCNDVMNHVNCIIKCDVYPQKMHSCSKNIHGISFFVLKISVVNQEKINLYQRCYCMGSPLCNIYPKRMHSCSKNIHGISFFVLKIYAVNQEKIHVYHRCYCIC